VLQLADCVGCGQTFSMPPFSIGPEDVDTEIETDDGMHDINTLFNRVHDLQRQLQEKDQTMRKQNEMLREKDKALQEQDKRIAMLLARQGRFNVPNSCVVQ
jgi:predicted secreted protein